VALTHSGTRLANTRTQFPWRLAPEFTRKVAEHHTALLGTSSAKQTAQQQRRQHLRSGASQRVVVGDCSVLASWCLPLHRQSGCQLRASALHRPPAANSHLPASWLPAQARSDPSGWSQQGVQGHGCKLQLLQHCW
jgi:hypothetical protein